MVKLNKQTTVTGACVLTVDGKEEQVAYMNASIPVGGAPNISRAIQNVELFNANKEEVLKDFAAFDNYVYSLMETEETKTKKQSFSQTTWRKRDLRGNGRKCVEE